MKTIYSMPTLEQAQRDTTNSINQCVIRLEKYLKMYGWQLTDNPDNADLIVAHAGAALDDRACDVAHCHGLYPTAQFDRHNWHYTANANVLGNLRDALHITVPSRWVCDVVQRECLRDATVVRWAIDRKEWRSGAHRGYTLWNKTRADDVCDPAPIDYLAQHIPDAQFVTTFTNLKKPPGNLKVTGRMPFEDMKEVVHDAALYLATTKETFGIGTLEAMACGTPILGYRWGGTADIVEHGVTGYLVDPGDLDGLLNGWRWCFRHRRTLAHNARQRATADFYSWDRVAEQFAGVYDTVYEQKLAQQNCPFDVSIIVPVHNYAHYVGLTLDTIASQQTDKRVEVVIVDDGSTDDLDSVLSRKLPTVPFKTTIIRHTTAQGVANARNAGISASVGAYVLCLDADDAISPDCVQTLANALDSDSSLDVVYGGLATIKSDDTSTYRLSDFPGAFNPHHHAQGRNQVPTCNMFRRTWWQRAGGYRSHLEPAEDAGLWFDMLMAGARFKKVTERPLFFYRVHDESLSAPVRRQQQREPRWMNRWSLRAIPAVSSLPPEAGKASHRVDNYDRPLVSIIIPVGRGHEQHVIRALDSIQAQSDPRWETIVVNDTGSALTIPHVWVRQVTPASTVGTGKARNYGLDIARGQFVVFLDADDWLRPDFIEECLQMHQRTGRYVYTDWIEHRDGHDMVVHQSEAYTQDKILNRMSIHAITALIPVTWARDVGGFDTEMAAWEDTDFFMKLAVGGYCGTHLPRPLFVYNYDSGQRRERAAAHPDTLKDLLKTRYGSYMKGDTMPCGCKDATVKTKTLDPNDGQDMLRVQMVTGGTAPSTLRGAATGTSYQRRKRGDVFLMYAEDVKAQPDKFVPVATVDHTVTPTADPEAPIHLEET